MVADDAGLTTTDVQVEAFVYLMPELAIVIEQRAADLNLLLQERALIQLRLAIACLQDPLFAPQPPCAHGSQAEPLCPYRTTPAREAISDRAEPPVAPLLGIRLQEVARTQAQLVRALTALTVLAREATAADRELQELVALVEHARAERPARDDGWRRRSAQLVRQDWIVRHMRSRSAAVQLREQWLSIHQIADRRRSEWEAATSLLSAPAADVAIERAA